jgi:hypothetical protein
MNARSNVRISEKGMAVINDRELAAKVVETIVAHKSDLKNGKTVPVDDEHISVKFVDTKEVHPHKK